MRNNRKTNHNILIVRISITKGIRIGQLRGNVDVSTHIGLKSSGILMKISNLNLVSFDNVMLQFGGNDVNKTDPPSFKTNVRRLVKCKNDNKSRRVIIRGFKPWLKTNVTHINDMLRSLSLEENLEFINHIDTIMLMNENIANNLLTPVVRIY